MERLFRRRVPVERVITLELAKICTELSHEIRRQIGLIINRRGVVEVVIVGTDRQLVLPTLSRSRSGPRLLRGVRLVHTHLNDQPLTKDDLTDLALLRLDLMVAIGVGVDGGPANVSVAHLLPQNPQGRAYEELRPCSFYAFQMDCGQFVQSLEGEISKGTPTLRNTEGHSTAILVSVSTGSRVVQEDRLEELRGLTSSLGIHVLDFTVQRPHAINPKYMLGSGRIREVIIHALQCGAEMLIFDQNLTPTQIRTISELTEMKVLDRTQLILDIFSRRARTQAGKIQVELAQLKYLLPRLSQSSTAFSRLGGGVGGRGPGETKLETDLRRVRDRVAHLERELQVLAKYRVQQRLMRVRRGFPVVSIVGYTNAGKSTLLNVLTGSTVSVRNRPFETLDTVNRRFRLPNGREIILTDTVGFLRDLPEGLVQAFRTTLEELREADLLIHVVDASATDSDAQIQAVENILSGLAVDRIPQILVFNKCDRLSREESHALCRRRNGIGISAVKPETLKPLRLALEKALARVKPNGQWSYSAVARRGAKVSPLLEVVVP